MSRLFDSLEYYWYWQHKIYWQSSIHVIYIYNKYSTDSYQDKNIILQYFILNSLLIELLMRVLQNNDLL